MHRFLHNDVNPPDDVLRSHDHDESLTCYACGVTVDATTDTMDRALTFLPACVPGNPERSHHYVYVGPFGGALVGIDSDYLDCAYGDAVIRPETVGATLAPCVGA